MIRACAVVVAACATTAPAAVNVTNSARVRELPADEWAAVTPGVAFQLRSPEGAVVVVRVDRVELTAETRTVYLTWEGGVSMHDRIEVTADDVVFVGLGLRFMRSAARSDQVNRSSPRLTLAGREGSVCYVLQEATEHSRPGELCIHRTRGIVSGYGLDWPGDGYYQAARP